MYRFSTGLLIAALERRTVVCATEEQAVYARKRAVGLGLEVEIITLPPKKPQATFKFRDLIYPPGAPESIFWCDELA